MYRLNPLPYDYDALEPFIDTHTLGLHYNKHQKSYLNNLNKILISNNFDFKYPIEELPLHLNEFNRKDLNDIMYNLGGVLNHANYFRSISPNKIKPSAKLSEEINKTFGDMEKFYKEFKTAALSIKGSGYTFLVINQSGKLQIVNLLNQDNPYFYNMVPLLTLDMWEHAYYLNYKNLKAEYIDNFFEILDFELANDIYNNLKTRTH